MLKQRNPGFKLNFPTGFDCLAQEGGGGGVTSEGCKTNSKLVPVQTKPYQKTTKKDQLKPLGIDATLRVVVSSPD